MIKLLLVALLVLSVNCQLISIGGSGYGRTVLLSPNLNGVSSLGSYGLGSLGYTSYGGLGDERNIQSLYGLRPLGGIGLNYHLSDPIISADINPAHNGFGYSAIGGLRPEALNLVSASHAISAKDSVPVSAAVKQIGRTVEYRSHPYDEEPHTPQLVVVDPSDIPLHIHFKSRSSTIRLTQEHIPGEPGTFESTRSQDEPSRVNHEVSKPVIQEVREIVQPIRRVTQELQPVIENVHTVVNKGEGKRRRYGKPESAGNGGRIIDRANHQIIPQSINGYQSIYQQPNVLLNHPNIYDHRTPFVNSQSVYENAIRSLGHLPIDRQIISPFGQTYDHRIINRPIDGLIRNGYEYSRDFNSGFGTGIDSGRRPDIVIGPNNGGRVQTDSKTNEQNRPQTQEPSNSDRSDSNSDTTSDDSNSSSDDQQN